jgi:hypothetical protein
MDDAAPHQAPLDQAPPAPARRGRSGLFLVTVYALICAGIFLLQLFPLTGIFLMLFAAALWIGVVIHIAMIHILIASLARSIARAWVLLPVAFYVAGVALYVVASREVKAQTRAIEEANAAVTITAEQPFTYTYKDKDYGSPDTRLLELYRTDRMVLPLGHNSRDGAAVAYYYGHGDACINANQMWLYGKRFEPFLRIRDLFPDYKGPNKTRQCIISQNGALEDTRYRIEAERTNARGWLFDRYGTRWTVYDAKTGGRLLVVQSAQFSVVYPIPFLLAGCGLNDSTPGWDCAAALLKTFYYSAAGYRLDGNKSNYPSPSSDPETWVIRPLARALSLELRQPTD